MLNFHKFLKIRLKICSEATDLAYLNWNYKTKATENSLVIISITLFYICLVFGVKTDIFKVLDALIFQKSQKITWKFVSADLVY